MWLTEEEKEKEKKEQPEYNKWPHDDPELIVAINFVYFGERKEDEKKNLLPPILRLSSSCCLYLVHLNGQRRT